MDPIEDKIKEVIADQLGIHKAEIKESSSILDDLGADSLDLVEILMAVEEDFNVSIPDETEEGIKTVGQLAGAVRTLTLPV
jgi:acyl carrier protein